MIMVCDVKSNGNILELPPVAVNEEQVNYAVNDLVVYARSFQEVDEIKIWDLDNKKVIFFENVKAIRKLLGTMPIC